MRSCRWSYIVVSAALLAVCLCMSGCMKGKQAGTSGSTSPQLLRVVMYTWALETGGVSMDLSTSTLESFPRNLPLTETEKKALGKPELVPGDIYLVRAKPDMKDMAELESLVTTPGLRDFEPRDNDITDRMPMLDECPPTLVLIWSDRTQVLSLPLRGTVKANISPDRAECYRAMEEITDHMSDMVDRYGKPPSVSIVSVKGTEYRSFERERDRLVH